MGKRELVALLNLSSWCLVMVEWLFLAVPWGCLRFVIVVFPDHSHLLFLHCIHEQDDSPMIRCCQSTVSTWLCSKLSVVVNVFPVSSVFFLTLAIFMLHGSSFMS